MSGTPDLWIPFGKLGRAHGVRGELRLVHHNTAEAFPAKVTRVRLCAEGAAPRVVPLARARSVHEGTLVTFEEVTDRDGASALAGVELEVAASDLPPLDEGEFYLFELIGAQAVDEAGEELGRVARIANLRGNDVMALVHEGGELWVPLGDETVQALERAERRVILRLPEGLVE